MTNEELTSHPFQPGTEVAIVVKGDWRAPHGFRKGVVAKVHKSGKFTLDGSPQQWHPYCPSPSTKFWHAYATGKNNGELRIVDATTIDRINEDNARYRRYYRYVEARRAIERQSFSDLVTDDALEKLEAVVAALKPVPEVKP